MQTHTKWKLIVLPVFCFLVSSITVSDSYARCEINISAENNSTRPITFNPKKSKVTTSTGRSGKVWKKIFNRSSVRGKRNIVPAGSKNYNYIYKPTLGCKVGRTFRFVIEQGGCQKSFSGRLKDLRRSKRGRITEQNLDLGDISKYCK